MNRPLHLALLLGLSLAAGCQTARKTPPPAAAKPGFVRIFDGKTLNGWSGRTDLWSVRDGTISGETKPENPIKNNTFLVWTAGTVDNFELRLKYRILNGNSGIQYRRDRKSTRLNSSH